MFGVHSRGISRGPALFSTAQFHTLHISTYMESVVNTCTYTLCMSIHNFVAWMDAAERNVHCRHASYLAFNTFLFNTIRFWWNCDKHPIRVESAECISAKLLFIILQNRLWNPDSWRSDSLSMSRKLYCLVIRDTDALPVTMHSEHDSGRSRVKNICRIFNKIQWYPTIFYKPTRLKCASMYDTLY